MMRACSGGGLSGRQPPYPYRKDGQDAGFTVNYFTEGLPQDRAGYEVIYGTVPQGAEGRHGPAVVLLLLYRYGSVEGRCHTSLPQPVMLAPPEHCGVTISEHMVMVTLMLLRQMPTVQEWMRRHDWSNEKPPWHSVCGSRIGAGYR